ncbi:MAG: sigma-54-dependent Fis family transcriptional regulator [Myxococcota bacterium]
MSAPDTARPSVLVVDDEPDNIALLMRIFRVGFRLWVAYSAEEAREILQGRTVDAIITDQRLPGMHGTSLLEHVRSVSPATRRVLITAYGDSPNVVAACESGIVERFFLKPYAPVALKSAVLELLRGSEAEHAPLVLVAESEPGVIESINDVLQTRGLRTALARDLASAQAIMDLGTVDAAIVSTSLEGGDTLSLLQAARACDPNVPVIFLTNDDPKAGLSMMEAGAFDFSSKPVRPAELGMRVERAVRAIQQAREHKRLLADATEEKYLDRVVARSEVMQRALATARTVARHDVNTLVLGETGTGKEVFARIIHEASRRAAGPFIAVNCGAIPEQLVESALFGHERGAFTDARERRVGVFEAADGGTLFLDEIGELSLSAQVRLLRVLETREFTRVGSNDAIPVDVRVVSATHRDLQGMVADKRVREDFFFRLNTVNITLPPLRERRDDIPAFLEFAVAAFASRNAIPVPRITTNAVHMALAYSWPGNVRELLHVVERTLITRGSDALDVLDLSASPEKQVHSNAVNADLPMRAALDPIIMELERRYIIEALARCGGHLARTAEHAGIHRKSLYNKMRAYGLAAHDKTESS